MKKCTKPDFRFSFHVQPSHVDFFQNNYGHQIVAFICTITVNALRNLLCEVSPLPSLILIVTNKIKAKDANIL